MSGLLTVKEAAEALRLSPSTVYALVARGHLRAARVGPRRGKVLIPADALDDYLGGAAGPEAAAPPPGPAASPAPKPLRHFRL